MESIARIRREHLIKGNTTTEIARDLRVPSNTVRKLPRSGETRLKYERKVHSRDENLAGGRASSARCGRQCAGP